MRPSEFRRLTGHWNFSFPICPLLLLRRNRLLIGTKRLGVSVRTGLPPQEKLLRSQQMHSPFLNRAADSDPECRQSGS